MTPTEITQVIGIVRALRNVNASLNIARKFELEACIEIYLQLPDKATGHENAVFPGINLEVTRSVLMGIIAGRPHDGGCRWALQAGGQI